MAIRTKTIEFAYPFDTTSVAAATARNFTTNTLYIPETTSLSFKSVILEVSLIDDVGATPTSITSVLLGIGLGAVAVNTATVTQTIVNSGESQSFTFTRDVTSYFVSNWTGTSMTSSARITIGASATINASAKLIITYEYDDTSQTTRIKTVKIPIDGNISTLTTSPTNIGAANQVPNLDTFLPEASKIYRNIFFESYSHMGNIGTTNTTNATCTLNFNGPGNLTSGSYDMQMSTDRSFKRIDEITNLTTNTQSSITASLSNITSITMPCMCGVLVVTYEYDHSTSTSIINSLEIPIFNETGVQGGPNINERSVFRTEFLIEEPSTITLVQSGVLISFLDGGAVNTLLSFGSQAYRTYAHSGGGNRVGTTMITRRIDSGETGGTAGITLARGLNTFDVQYYNTGTTSGTLGMTTTGILYLNYTSGKHSDGDGAHAHTIKLCNREYSLIPTIQRTQYIPSRIPSIPESDYNLISNGYEIISLFSGAQSALQFNFSAEYASTEGAGAGWRDLTTIMYNNLDAETGTMISWINTSNAYKRNPLDPDNDRLDIEISRNNQINVNSLTHIQMIGQYITYNSISYTISGTISGSNGGTVNIEVYRTDNNELIASTSRTGNGSYSMTWYDNTIPVFVFAYESSTYKGVSVEQVAGNTFDVPLASSGGPTYYSYL